MSEHYRSGGPFETASAHVWTHEWGALSALRAFGRTHPRKGRGRCYLLGPLLGERECPSASLDARACRLQVARKRLPLACDCAARAGLVREAAPGPANGGTLPYGVIEFRVATTRNFITTEN
jgi:hypothetical protein